MLFNSLIFFKFLVIVYAGYLLLQRFDYRWQNRFLLIANYYFYGTWNWRFLFLLFFSTACDYFFALKIDQHQNNKRKKKLFLVIPILINLAILAIFKYYNFFVTNVEDLCATMGIHFTVPLLNVILPVGLSFYTFQSMSYLIDVYRRELKPCHDFWDYAVYVSFFPQLVAGPIERGKSLLPQITQKRVVTLEKFYEGSFIIFWGLFQKVVIADNLSKIVDPVFHSHPPYNGLKVMLASYAFVFQIYCDFAGYSEMARGLGKILGVELRLNFNMPYFSTNVQEFWNRWHMSLSTWIRDYLYLPLFQSLNGVKGNIRIFIPLLVSMSLMGLWHGAAWTYVFMGVYYGILLCVYMVIRLKCQGWIQPKSVWGQGLWKWSRILMILHSTVVGMMIFRCESVKQIFEFIVLMHSRWHLEPGLNTMLSKILFFVSLMAVVQIYQYKKQDLLAVYKAPLYIKVPFYIVTLLLLSIYGVTEGKQFIYFQF